MFPLHSDLFHHICQIRLSAIAHASVLQAVANEVLYSPCFGGVWFGLFLAALVSVKMRSTTERNEMTEGVVKRNGEFRKVTRCSQHNTLPSHVSCLKSFQLRCACSSCTNEVENKPKLFQAVTRSSTRQCAVVRRQKQLTLC